MRRLISAMALAMAITLSGCGGSEEPEQRTTSEQGGGDSHMGELKQLPQGFSGGCTEGIELWSQKQFTPYGAKARRTLDGATESVGMKGNVRLHSIGWVKTDFVIYPKNPQGIRGVTWYYIPKLPDRLGGGNAWIADAAVRKVETEPAPGDLDKYYDRGRDQAPKPAECELKPTD